jgi:hypothetical protein
MSEDLLIFLFVAACIALPLVLMFFFMRGMGGMFGGLLGSFGLAKIKGGVSTQAVVQSIGESGMTISSPSVGPDAPVYELGLLVTPPGGGEAYAAECKCAIPRVFIPMLVPGAHIGVVVDPANPQKVVPDWQNFSGSGGQTMVASDMTGAQALNQRGGTVTMDGVDVAFAAGGQPVSGLDKVVGAIRGGTMNTEHGSAARLLATGTHGTGVITTAQPLGKKVRDFDPNADPTHLDDPMWLFTLEVTLPGGSAFPAMFGHRVPASEVAGLAPGVKLAVAVDESNPTQECAIDWDRSPLR